MHWCSLPSFLSKELSVEVAYYMSKPEWRHMQQGKWWAHKQWGVGKWKAALQ